MADKKRGPNWSSEEKAILVEEFVKHKHIIRGRFSTKITAQTKKDAWVKVMDAVNSHNPDVKRDIESVKKKWDNILSVAKKDIIDYKKELRKTGGGPPPRELPALTQKIWEVFGEDSPSLGGLQFGIESGIEVAPETANDNEDVEGRFMEPTDYDGNPSRSLIVSPSPSSIQCPNPTPTSSRCTTPTPTSSQCPTPNETVGAISRKRKGDTSNMAADIQMLHKDVLLAEKEKIGLEEKKLKLEIEKLSLEIEILQHKKQKQQYMTQWGNRDVNIDNECHAMYNSPSNTYAHLSSLRK